MKFSYKKVIFFSGLKNLILFTTLILFFYSTELFKIVNTKETKKYSNKTKIKSNEAELLSPEDEVRRKTLVSCDKLVKARITQDLVIKLFYLKKLFSKNRKILLKI